MVYHIIPTDDDVTFPNTGRRMKSNQPDDEGSTNESKRTLDHDYLSEWECLTKLYDSEDVNDRNHLSATGTAPNPPQQGRQQHKTESNHNLRAPLKRDRTEMEQERILRQNFEEATGRALHLPPSRQLSTVQTVTTYPRETNSNLSQNTTSIDHQRWVINPTRYFDRSEYVSTCQSTPSEAMSGTTQHDGSFSSAISLTHPTLFTPNTQLPTNMQHQESSGSSKNMLNFLSTVATDNLSQIPSAVKEGDKKYGFVNHDRSLFDANEELPFEPWPTQLELEPISVFTQTAETPDSVWFDVKDKILQSERKCAVNVETKPENSSNDTNVGSAGNVVDSLVGNSSTATYFHIRDAATIQTGIHANMTMDYVHNDSGTLVNAVSRASTEVTTAQQQVPCWFTELAQKVPPYQQLKNNSLLLKPLTPYNYYYRDERDNIVLQMSDVNDQLPQALSDFTLERMQSLLSQHWHSDPLRTKRIHRKTHGKMSFQKLSSIISERWRTLSNQGREFYRSVARYDEMYYSQHLMMQLNNESNIGPLLSVDDDGATETADDVKSLKNSD